MLLFAATFMVGCQKESKSTEPGNPTETDTLGVGLCKYGTLICKDTLKIYQSCGRFESTGISLKVALPLKNQSGQSYTNFEAYDWIVINPSLVVVYIKGFVDGKEDFECAQTTPVRDTVFTKAYTQLQSLDRPVNIKCDAKVVVIHSSDVEWADLLFFSQNPDATDIECKAYQTTTLNKPRKFAGGVITRSTTP